MTREEADNYQEWRGMDGAIAFHLIDRHAEGWDEIAMMMDAWRRANVNLTDELQPALQPESDLLSK